MEIIKTNISHSEKWLPTVGHGFPPSEIISHCLPYYLTLYLRPHVLSSELPVLELSVMSALLCTGGSVSSMQHNPGCGWRQVMSSYVWFHEFYGCSLILLFFPGFYRICMILHKFIVISTCVTLSIGIC